MVDEAWRKSVQLEVAHPIGTDDHCCSFGVERIHHTLKSLGRTVEVVAIKLHDKASHHRMVYCHVPAAANAEVVAVRNDVDK